MARGKHLFPFRTEPLSPSAPMVLGPQGPGRVGRRRFFLNDTGRLRAARRRQPPPRAEALQRLTAGPRSARQDHAAIVGERPARVVSYLPRMTVRVEEDARVPAPESL